MSSIVATWVTLPPVAGVLPDSLAAICGVGEPVMASIAEASGRVGVERSPQFLEGVRAGDVVIVNNPEPGAGHQRHGQIDGRGLALVFSAHIAHLRVARCDVRRVVGRSIIYQDDFIRLYGLGKNGLQGIRKKRRSVAGRNDYRGRLHSNRVPFWCSRYAGEKTAKKK